MGNIQTNKQIKICSGIGCTKKAIARGFCGKPHYAKGLCQSHFNKARRKEGYCTKHARTPKTRFTTCKRTSRHRDLEWSIPFDVFCTLITKPCSYCSGPLPQTGAGLDRIDNKLDYIESNVVPACWFCNHLRSDVFTYEQFVEFSKTDLFNRVITALKLKAMPKGQKQK